MLQNQSVSQGTQTHCTLFENNDKAMVDDDYRVKKDSDRVENTLYERLQLIELEEGWAADMPVCRASAVESLQQSGILEDYVHLFELFLGDVNACDLQEVDWFLNGLKWEIQESIRLEEATSRRLRGSGSFVAADFPTTFSPLDTHFQFGEEEHNSSNSELKEAALDSSALENFNDVKESEPHVSHVKQKSS